MSREQQTTELINDIGWSVNATEVLLADIAVSLAQIADRLNGVILTNETSKFGWVELGGKGGE